MGSSTIPGKTLPATPSLKVLSWPNRATRSTPGRLLLSAAPSQASLSSVSLRASLLFSRLFRRGPKSARASPSSILPASLLTTVPPLSPSPTTSLPSPPPGVGAWSPAAPAGYTRLQDDPLQRLLGPRRRCGYSSLHGTMTYVRLMSISDNLPSLTTLYRRTRWPPSSYILGKTLPATLP